MKRQGEILVIQVDEFPAKGNFEPVSPENGRLIVGHSETGHHHVIELVKSPNAKLLVDKTNEFIALLDLGEDAVIEHLRSFDTHKPLHLKKGKHIVRHRREFTPEGLRRVED